MKKGITIVSLTIYIVLFFSLTILATFVTTNFNKNLLQEKGNIIINEETIKLQSNLLNSGKNSISITKQNNIINFSNGDVYTFDQEKKNILKNNGVLVSNVINFKVIDSSVMTNNSLEEYKSLAVYVEFKKYDIVKKFNIFVGAGDE